MSYQIIRKTRRITLQDFDATDIPPAALAPDDVTSEPIPATITELLLLVPGRTQPIFVRGQEAVVLGRRDRRNNTQPTVDLTDYNGATLGVSRMHAKIVYLNDQYYVQDMASTNGTRINGKRLAPYQTMPLFAGDTLVLGQMTISVM